MGDFSVYCILFRQEGAEIFLGEVLGSGYLAQKSLKMRSAPLFRHFGKVVGILLASDVLNGTASVALNAPPKEEAIETKTIDKYGGVGILGQELRFSL